MVDRLRAIGCSVNLDLCCKHDEPDVERWDYVLVATSGGRPGIGMEVHHATADEVPRMIAKKRWAAALLQRECPQLGVASWQWIIPAGAEVYFTQNSPRARQLAEEGIEFPRSKLITAPSEK